MSANSILLVDDDKDTCANLSDILTDVGYKVVVAYDPETALRIVGQNGYRLGLLDYKLPSMTGLDLFRQIRRQKEHLACVLVSGFASPEVIEMAMAEGMRAVFPKPVDFAKLMPVVEEVVGTP
jgi:two-component system, NtrC family, response regulator HydG